MDLLWKEIEYYFEKDVCVPILGAGTLIPIMGVKQQVPFYTLDVIISLM
jgi:hypothetical protein